jgi:hypothetical protein
VNGARPPWVLTVLKGGAKSADRAAQDQILLDLGVLRPRRLRAQLGHTNVAITHQSYTQPAAVAGAKQDRGLTVLAGGRQ